MPRHGRQVGELSLQQVCPGRQAVQKGREGDRCRDRVRVAGTAARGRQRGVKAAEGAATQAASKTSPRQRCYGAVAPRGSGESVMRQCCKPGARNAYMLAAFIALAPAGA